MRFRLRPKTGFLLYEMKISLVYGISEKVKVSKGADNEDE